MAVRKWQGRRDSNPRPSVLETDALPTELHPYAFHARGAAQVSCSIIRCGGEGQGDCRIMCDYLVPAPLLSIAPPLPLAPGARGVTSRDMTLDTDLLLKAYAIGVFPMADSRDDAEVFWVEPQMRAIFPLEEFHLSRSLAKTLKQDRFEFTCDAAFAQVIAACAETSNGKGAKDRAETWINREIETAYTALNRQGNAHSIECWQDGALVGGLYGVSIGRAFCGESMFSRVRDASKAALAALVAAMRLAGYELLDCQFMTDHLASMGAREIAQKDYLRLLARALYGVDVDSDSRGEDAADQPSSPPSATGAGAGADSAGAGAAGAVSPALSLPEALSALLDGAEAAGALGAGVDLAGFGKSSSPGKRIAQSLTHTS